MIIQHLPFIFLHWAW